MKQEDKLLNSLCVLCLVIFLGSVCIVGCGDSASGTGGISPNPNYPTPVVTITPFPTSGPVYTPTPVPTPVPGNISGNYSPLANNPKTVFLRGGGFIPSSSIEVSQVAVLPTPLATALTDPNTGNYLITGIYPGEYTVDAYAAAPDPVPPLDTTATPLARTYVLMTASGSPPVTGDATDINLTEGQYDPTPTPTPTPTVTPTVAVTPTFTPNASGPVAFAVLSQNSQGFVVNRESSTVSRFNPNTNELVRDGSSNPIILQATAMPTPGVVLDQSNVDFVDTFAFNASVSNPLRGSVFVLDRRVTNDTNDFLWIIDSQVDPNSFAYWIYLKREDAVINNHNPVCEAIHGSQSSNPQVAIASSGSPNQIIVMNSNTYPSSVTFTYYNFEDPINGVIPPIWTRAADTVKVAPNPVDIFVGDANRPSYAFVALENDDSVGVINISDLTPSALQRIPLTDGTGSPDPLKPLKPIALDIHEEGSNRVRGGVVSVTDYTPSPAGDRYRFSLLQVGPTYGVERSISLKDPDDATDYFEPTDVNMVPKGTGSFAYISGSFSKSGREGVMIVDVTKTPLAITKFIDFTGNDFIPKQYWQIRFGKDFDTPTSFLWEYVANHQTNSFTVLNNTTNSVLSGKEVINLNN